MSLSATRKTKLRKCKQCKTWFVPQYNTIQATCSVMCAILYAAAQKAKEAKVARTRARVELREYRARSMSLSKLKNLSQREFNRYIRERDHGQPCISCGRDSGAKVNAGHYRTTKAAPHLRFDERACFLQCEHCNTYLSGNQVEYRKALVARFGADYVDELDRDSGDLKWSRDELTAIRRKYLGLWKALRAAREGKA